MYSEVLMALQDAAYLGIHSIEMSSMSGSTLKLRVKLCGQMVVWIYFLSSLSLLPRNLQI